jgi:hypothetical protein
MIRMIRTTVLALVACALAAPSHAGLVIDWDPAYFYSTTPGVTATNAPAGSNLFIVGTVSVFAPPLQFLNANDPTKDYTFYIHGMSSNGTTPTAVPPLGTAYVTTYTVGTIELYEGTPRDAAFDPNPPNANVPSTFTNGTLLLSGTFYNFYTQTNNFSNFSTGNAEANISWTGGTLLPFMSPGGHPCPSLFTGGLSWHPGVVIPGYLFRHDGKIDLECPTPARSSTWGKIKALYR